MRERFHCFHLRVDWISDVIVAATRKLAQSKQKKKKEMLKKEKGRAKAKELKIGSPFDWLLFIVCVIVLFS